MSGNITDWGRRIWQACPPPNSLGISERTLIEKLNGLGAYADYQRGIKELVDTGYLLQNKSTQTYKRSKRVLE
jgi:hypothetical protein